MLGSPLARPASPRKLRVLTNSELKTLRRCAFEHRLAYGLGYRSVREADALRFGTVIHVALEAWWRQPDRELRLTAALATLPLDGDPFELARAVQMISGYDLRWRDEPLEVLAVELEFRAPIVNPRTRKGSRLFESGGKIDAVARNLVDGRTYIVEHKTSSDDLTPGSVYWQCLQLDAQVSTYYAGARALGFDVSGVIYDVLGRPKLKPLKATPLEDRKYRKDDGVLYVNMRAEDETPLEYEVRVRDAIAEAPDRYYVRGEVVRLDDEEKLAAWDTWQLAQLLHEGERAGRYPRNPDACRRFGRLCSYFGVCTRTESLDDAERFRRVENVHEELTAEGWTA
jgi:PD-(D/E)XK nuclease superfamily